MKWTQLAWLLLLVAQALLGGGCATSLLWQEGQFARYREPAKPLHPRLSYSMQTKDVLLEYDESREDSDSIRRRAYWLDRNDMRVERGKMPRFVAVSHTQAFTPVPVYESRPVSIPDSADGLYGVVWSQGSLVLLTLYSQTKAPGSNKPEPEEVQTYRLPVYPDGSGRWKQVLLTPFAVTADVTIVGGMIALVAWSHSDGLTVRP